MQRRDRAPARPRLRHLRADRRLSRQDLWAVRRGARGYWRGSARICKARSTACWATTTRSAWCRGSRPWASACCSTNAWRSCATRRESIWPASTTRISYRVDNIEKAARSDPRGGVLRAAVAYAGDLPPSRPCRFRPAAERAYAWRANLPAGRFRSRSIRTCHAASARERGAISGWPAILRLAPDHRSSPFGSTARQKSRCITCTALKSFVVQ